MFINIVESQNERGWSYLNFDKKEVDILSEDVIIPTWSQASNLAKSLIKPTKTISLKEFILTEDGKNTFEKFCLNAMQ